MKYTNFDAVAEGTTVTTDPGLAIGRLTLSENYISEEKQDKYGENFYKHSWITTAKGGVSFGKNQEV